jgi:hypothetical protein
MPHRFDTIAEMSHVKTNPQVTTLEPPPEKAPFKSQFLFSQSRFGAVFLNAASRLLPPLCHPLCRWLGELPCASFVQPVLETLLPRGTPVAVQAVQRHSAPYS